MSTPTTPTKTNQTTDETNPTTTSIITAETTPITTNDVKKESKYLKKFNWNELRREDKENVDIGCDIHDGEEHSLEELASFYSICIKEEFCFMKYEYSDLTLHKITFVAKSKYTLYSRLLPFKNDDLYQRPLLYSNSKPTETEDDYVIFSKRSIKTARQFFKKYYRHSKYLNNWTVFGDSDEYYCIMATYKSNQ
ncbi:hypothetical protein ACTA71_001683 [Dictyostelium dimigraforme]